MRSEAETVLTNPTTLVLQILLPWCLPISNLKKPEYSKKPSKKESNENGSKNGKPEQTGDNKVVAQYMKWGFLPFWAKEPKKFK